MVFWVHCGAGHGDKCHYSTPGHSREQNGPSLGTSFLAFSVMVTIAGVTKITTGSPGRTEGAMSQKASSLGQSLAGPTRSQPQTPLRVLPSSADTLNHGSRRVRGTYPCPTTQLPDVPLGTRDCSDQRTSPTMSCQAALHGLLASLSTLPFGGWHGHVLLACRHCIRYIPITVSGSLLAGT